jgi:transcriptional regulator with PAS, ATPase and Fis domain
MDAWAPSGVPIPHAELSVEALVRPQEPLGPPPPEEGERLVGRDPAFLEVLEKARRAAAYDLSMLIQGETGTGKGLLARLIHENSSRAGGSFISLNCAAIGAALAESELFGHMKGAFTGADHNRPGRLRTAEGGALFLDEIGDLPPEIQPKLLRTMEEKTILPVGAGAELTVNVRILAATNQDLPQLIAEGRFRRDLYERLAQFTLRLPPLRERRTDISLLIRRFLQDWNGKYREDKQISEKAMSYLLDYPWPGNVRELAKSVMGHVRCQPAEPSQAHPGGPSPGRSAGPLQP